MADALRFSIFALLTLFSAPTLACSVGGEYRVPTNLQLVEQADVILLGSVEAGDQPGQSISDASIIVTPLSALKGDAPDAPLTLPRLYIGEGQWAIPSNPYDLRYAHPVAYAGGCIRYSFAAGRTVLFFLTRHEGALVPMGQPFSRWAEDVPGDDAPWLRAVRIYLDVAALPQSEREGALIAARDALAARSGDPDATLIAADIERQLEGENRPWNELMQESIYGLGESDELLPEELRELDAAAAALDAEMDGMDENGEYAPVTVDTSVDEAARDIEAAAKDAVRAMEAAVESPND